MITLLADQPAKWTDPQTLLGLGCFIVAILAVYAIASWFKRL